MKKKIIFIILFSIITLCLTGCENKNQDEIDRIGDLINGT